LKRGRNFLHARVTVFIAIPGRLAVEMFFCSRLPDSDPASAEEMVRQTDEIRESLELLGGDF
jgi:hypothetical protein